jgi:hypothetical protein
LQNNRSIVRLGHNHQTLKLFKDFLLLKVLKLYLAHVLLLFFYIFIYLLYFYRFGLFLHLFIESLFVYVLKMRKLNLWIIWEQDWFVLREFPFKLILVRGDLILLKHCIFFLLLDYKHILRHSLAQQHHLADLVHFVPFDLFFDLSLLIDVKN